MNKEQKEKTVNENIIFPKIISEKKVFAEMSKTERGNFYNLVDSKITELAHKRGQSSYKGMLLDPEERLNQAFLKNIRKKPALRVLYVTVFEECLHEHLLAALEANQKNHENYTTEMKRTELRIAALQQNIETYTPKASSDEKS